MIKECINSYEGNFTEGQIYIFLKEDIDGELCYKTRDDQGNGHVTTGSFLDNNFTSKYMALNLDYENPLVLTYIGEPSTWLTNDDTYILFKDMDDEDWYVTINDDNCLHSFDDKFLEDNFK